MSTDIITESIQQFNLKWTNYTANLLEILADKLNKGFLTDVTLSCEGTLIRAHKLVLAACSPYFEHLFEVYNESNPLIILNGVQLKDLKILLQFMYRGEIKIRENEVHDILKLSNDLQVKGLSDAKVNWALNKSFENSKNELSQPSSNLPVTPPVPSDNIKKPTKLGSSQTECNTENLKVNPSFPSTSLPMKRSLPPKAFMVYAKIMRRKLADTYPNEPPKNISVRIGDLWKQLSNDEKMKFYEMAKWQIDSDSVSCFTPEDDEQNDNLKRKRSNEDVKIPLNRNIPSVIKHALEEDDDDDDVEFVEVTKNLLASTSNGNS